MSEFKVGDTVCYVDDFTFYGEIIKIESPDSGKYCHIKWQSGRITDCCPDDIRVYDLEAEKIKSASVQAKIDSATSSLQAAFQAWREAAALQQGTDAGAYVLRHNPLLNLTDFESAASEFGWDSSSLYC